MAVKAEETQSTILVTLEVGKCKKLWQDPDAPLVSSPQVSVALEGTTTLLTTNVMPETADPFFNETFEFKVPTTLNEATGELGVKELVWSYEVVDTQFEPPRIIGEGELKLGCESNGKGESIMDLHISSAPEGDARGVIVFRYKITTPKPKVFDPNIDLKLPTLPARFSANFELVPFGAAPTTTAAPAAVAPPAPAADETTTTTAAAPLPSTNSSNKRTWSMFLELAPSSFREVFERRLVESFKEEKSERKHPTKTPNDVIALRWKCKRSHQFLTRLRLTAERFLRGEPLAPITQDDETVSKLRWKTLAYVHAAEAPHRSAKVTELIDRLWLYYCDGVDYRTTMSHISFEHRTKMQLTAFGQKEFELFTTCILHLFLPGLSQPMKDGLAREEWETDPACNPKALEEHMEHMKSLQELADAEKDTITKMAEKQLDEVLETRNSTSGIPTVSGDNFKLFDSTLRKYMDLWCETFTDAEAVAFLKAIAPAIPSTRSKLAAMGNDLGASGKTPRSGRGASQRRRSSARRRSSVKSPRTPR